MRKKKIEDYDNVNQSLIERFAYAEAKEQAELKEVFIKLHVKKKPRLMPRFLYSFCLKRLIELGEFKINNLKDENCM